MKKISFSILILIISFLKSVGKDIKYPYQYDIDLPTSTINKIWHNRCYTCKDEISIVEEFQEKIKQEINLGNKSNHPIIHAELFHYTETDSIIFLNIGWYNNRIFKFCIIKKIDSVWKLLYAEDIQDFDFSEGLDFRKAGSFNDYFVLNRVYSSERIISRFYKIINNKIYIVLELPKSITACGCGIRICSKIESNSFFNSDESVNVQYVYQYYLNNIDGPYDNLIIKQRTFYLIDEVQSVIYKWNPAQMKLIPHFDSDCKLNLEKINLFGTVGENKLFKKIYREELSKLQFEDYRSHIAVKKAVDELKKSQNDKYPCDIKDKKN